MPRLNAAMDGGENTNMRGLKSSSTGASARFRERLQNACGIVYSTVVTDESPEIQLSPTRRAVNTSPMEMGAYGNDDKHVDADNEDGKDGIAETEAHVVDYAVSVASAVEFINQNVNPLRENIADHHGIVPVLDGEEGATTVDVLDVLHNTVGNGEGVENYNQHGGGEELEVITLETSKSDFAKFKIPGTPVKILKGLPEEGVKKKVGGTEVVLSDEDSDDSDAFSPEILDSDYEVVSVGDNKSLVEPGLGGGRELASNRGRPIVYGGAMTSSKRDVYTPFQKWEYENGLPVDSITDV
ncbi:hypothetical protein KC19_VG035300 [Ceratodon purpureus]|uniref:Uncharacterized protein n=1 Tax=Ceratodon purpureus TaxID=3225 RepID=A0A8T0HLN7_CERPU|nr:hypothetical protein KC19_VG035300 [Ceratodon purpureus]KAG0571704.1 hypothetical protein KC19_VG035300 [Ceratodon purpureus]KAG0571705.1 hypothetical protein KC19_VG035300 [Ceratodon purpureus]